MSSETRRGTEAFELDSREIKTRITRARSPAELIDSLAGMSLASSFVPQDRKGEA